MSVLRKRDAALTPASSASVAVGGDFARSYPGVWECLASLHYSDGSPRVPATLTVFVDAGAVKACLNDRDQGLTGWAAAESVEACLAALERGLQSGTIDWRATAPPKRKK